MKINLSDKLIAWLALLSGLSISAVAIYYSVAGLMAIFAAAVIPIMIMGVVLEIGKLSATVWLKQNWQRAPGFLKTYLLLAILALMLLTSMGIFGYLSKAHLDQAVPTGDVAAKVSLLDEKIKTERDNIEASRKALAQMDSQVDQLLGRSDTERGAERAVQIRRQQQAERGRLQKDIADAQTRIAKLNEERAPIASELRKVEAEVGPIKYIAALIYGDNPDADLLERAVRWVIIVIVLVFDPLAVILLLASQYSFSWFRQQKEEYPEEKQQQELEPPLQESENSEYEPSPWPFPTAVEKEDDFKFLADYKDIEDKVQEPDIKEPTVQESDFDLDKDFLKEAKDRVKEKIAEAQENPSPIEQWNKMIEEAEKAIEEETKTKDNIELDPIDQEIIDDGEETDTAEIIELKRLWKEENPDGTLKQQRRLLAEGAIEELPWLTHDFRKKKKITYIEKIGKDQIRKESSEE